MCVQVAKAQCLEQEAGLVEEQYCQNQTRPEDLSRRCNTHACPAWWWSGPWQPCSITCGNFGIRRRTVICVRSFGPTEQMALLDSACDDSVKPHETEMCPTLPACPQLLDWSVGQWSRVCVIFCFLKFSIIIFFNTLLTAFQLIIISNRMNIS